MTDKMVERRWPFRHWWANVSLIVGTVVVCVYLLGIVSQILIKSGSSHGQQSVSTAEVEEEIRDTAVRQRAHVKGVQCSESLHNQWHCTIRLTDGRIASGNATWYQSKHVLGVNVQLAPR